jgi:SAM-dependent methyltransferase
MPAMDYAKIAHLYDEYVTTQFDVPFFLDCTRGCESVLELMCGTGRVSIPLLKAGVPLTCVDSSPDMLAVLHRKLAADNLSAPVHEMDVCALDLGRRFDRIILPFHAFAEIVAPDDQRRALQSIRRHLAEDGLFVCTLHNPPVRLRCVDGDLRPGTDHPMPDGGSLRVSRVESYDPSSRLVSGAQTYEVYSGDGALTETQSIEIRFFVHDRAGFASLIQSQGFAVESLYGDYARSAYREEESPYMIWVLKKGNEPSAAGDADKPRHRGRDWPGGSSRALHDQPEARGYGPGPGIRDSGASPEQVRHHRRNGFVIRAD